MNSPLEAGHPASPESYRYAAFISYRHVEPDRNWAKWLHTSLEAYRVPKQLVNRHRVAPKLNRVFRDEEELHASANLSKEIEGVLKASKFLIVICSPRTPGSEWVNKEVERFRELGRHDQILALLIEGEPGDSFPRSLREIRRKVVDAGGIESETIEDIEPLAADVRASRDKSPRSVRRLAKLRLVACLLGLRFDDLRQREHERRVRFLAAMSSTLSVLVCFLAALAWFALHQRAIANANAVRADAQARRADEQAHLAEVRRGEAETERRSAEIRLAESLSARGDAAASAGDWQQARSSYEQAAELFERLGSPSLAVEARLFNAYCEAPPPLCILSSGPEVVESAAFSPDARKIAIGRHDGSCAIFDVLTGRLLQTFRDKFALPVGLRPDNPLVRFISFDSKGDRLFAATAGGLVRLWDAHSGAELRRWRMPVAISAAAISPDGQFALTHGEDGILRRFDLSRDSSGLEVVCTRPGPASQLAISPDGARLLIGGVRPKSLFDLRTREWIPAFTGFEAPFNAVAFAPDGQLIATGTADGDVRIWDRDGIKSIAYVDQGRVESLTFTSAGDEVLNCPDHALSWRLPTTKGPQSLPPRPIYHDAAPHAVVSFDGRLCLTFGGDDGELRLWRADGSDFATPLVGHQGAATSVALSADGRLGLSGGADQSLCLWDIATRRELLRLVHGGPVTAVALSPDGTRALSGGGGKTVRLWDLTRGVQTGQWVVPEPPLQVAFSPDGLWGFAAGAELIARWTLSGGTPQLLYRSPNVLVKGLFLSADGTQVLAAGNHGYLWGWDLPSGQLKGNAGAVLSFTHHVREIRDSAFSPDGKQVLSVRDNDLILWDGATASVLRTFSGHETQTCVAMSAHGSVAVSGTVSGAVRVWEVSTGRLLQTFSPPTRTASAPAGIAAVAISADGHVILAGYEGGLVRAWDLACMASIRVGAARAAQARETLREHSEDGNALAALGDWYASRRRWDWAAEFLERAAVSGVRVSSLTLGRCYAQSGRPADAARELEQAIHQSEAGIPYLHICIEAERRRPMPSTQPATSAIRPENSGSTTETQRAQRKQQN